MKSEHAMEWSRRDFARGLALAGTAGLVGLRPAPAEAEPPPETTKLRLFQAGVTCLAPQYVAQELLYSEGFTDVRYIKNPNDTRAFPPEVLLSGEVDISLSFGPTNLVHIDAGEPVVILAGSHIGCVELVGSNRIRSTVELKGRTVGVYQLRSGDDYVFTAMFAAHVGLDPQKDINWVATPDLDERIPLLAKGKIDAFMTGPPWSLDLRAKKIGHVLVNTTTDKPWSQYFCCMVTSTKESVRKHPVATKRALRAILKAADVCALEPERIARSMVDKGQAARYDYALQVLKEIPYGKWREYDAADSVRFYALWMRDAGIIKSSPQKIIERGTDLRFLNELKKELKG